MVEQSLGELERKLRETEAAYSRLYDEKRRAEQKYIECLSGLGNRVRKIGETGSQLRKEFEDLVHTDGKRIEELAQMYGKSEEFAIEILKLRTELIKFRNPSNKRNGLDFEFWEKSVTYSINESLNKVTRDVGALGREAGALRGALFTSEMNRLVVSNPNFKDVPFAYYDFSNRKSIYTIGILNLLKVDPDKAKNKELSLLRLIEYINKTYRSAIVEALKEGTEIENYPVKTAKENKELILNAYPLVFDNNPVGVGIFFYNPDTPSLKFTSMRFGLSLRKLISNISDEFQVLRKNSREVGEYN